MDFSDILISKLAIEIPGATAIFFANNINFCSEGDKTLTAIIQRQGGDGEAIYTALEALRSSRNELADIHMMPNYVLIEYVIERFHDAHRRQLPELIRLAKLVESTHTKDKHCPIGLSEYLQVVLQDLELHMQQEEQVLFPMLMDNFNAMANPRIKKMMTEHDDHLNEIKNIYDLTFDISLHPGACITWKALYAGIREFIEDVQQHVFIENNILFAR